MSTHSDSAPVFGTRSARTAELVGRLHDIVNELEQLHPGRRFPLDGHLVGSLGEAAAEAEFDIELVTAGSPGHDAVAADGRTVKIKATYGDSGVGLRSTSHDGAAALVVLRLSRQSGQRHEVVYNGPLANVLQVAGPIQSNGQARLALHRLRELNDKVPEQLRIPRRSDGVRPGRP